MPLRLLILLSLLTGLSRTAFAQSEVPEASVLQWQLIGVDNEFVMRHKAALESLRSALAAQLLTNAQPVTAQLGGRTLSYNRTRALQPVLSGAPRLPVPGPVLILPIACRIGEQMIFAVELIDLKTQLLLASHQQFTAWEPWSVAANARPGASWSAALTTRLGQTRGLDAEAPAFKLGLGLLRGSSNGFIGGDGCLNMLLAHELHKSFAVAAPFDALEAYRMRETFSPGQPQRPTRRLLFDWGKAPRSQPHEAYTLQTEVILGSPLAPPQKMSFPINVAEERMEIPPAFIEALGGYRRQLLLADQPQVSKIMGAWAYVDRGRAWGLKMNDRLYFDVDGRFVKGHVVGYYGSEEKIRSPRGFEVQEGAIIFIRKGQKTVRVGDTLGYDPTVFPTPWPPVRQPSNAPAN